VRIRASLCALVAGVAVALAVPAGREARPREAAPMIGAYAG
jgi:hypothetical protein